MKKQILKDAIIRWKEEDYYKCDKRNTRVSRRLFRESLERINSGKAGEGLGDLAPFRLKCRFGFSVGLGYESFPADDTRAGEISGPVDEPPRAEKLVIVFPFFFRGFLARFCNQLIS